MSRRVWPSPRMAARLAMLSTFLLCGCGDPGDGRPREPISGKVTLDGKPLASGLIQFVPLSEAGDPTHVGAVVKEGDYAISRENGPVPGAYSVSITAGAGVEPPADELPGAGKAPKKDLIPPAYNLKTTLEAKVEAGKTNVFDFALTSTWR